MDRPPPKARGHLPGGKGDTGEGAIHHPSPSYHLEVQPLPPWVSSTAQSAADASYDARSPASARPRLACMWVKAKLPADVSRGLPGCFSVCCRPPATVWCSMAAYFWTIMTEGSFGRRDTLPKVPTGILTVAQPGQGPIAVLTRYFSGATRRVAVTPVVQYIQSRVCANPFPSSTGGVD